MIGINSLKIAKSGVRYVDRLKGKKRETNDLHKADGVGEYGHTIIITAELKGALIVRSLILPLK